MDASRLPEVVQVAGFGAAKRRSVPDCADTAAVSVSLARSAREDLGREVETVESERSAA